MMMLLILVKKYRNKPCFFVDKRNEVFICIIMNLSFIILLGFKDVFTCFTFLVIIMLGDINV